jgi:hypothetical protein
MGGKVAVLVEFHEKAPGVLEDLGFDQDEFGDLQGSKPERHYRSTSESSPMRSRVAAWGRRSRRTTAFRPMTLSSRRPASSMRAPSRTTQFSREERRTTHRRPTLV